MCPFSLAWLPDPPCQKPRPAGLFRWENLKESNFKPPTPYSSGYAGRWRRLLCSMRLLVSLGFFLACAKRTTAAPDHTNNTQATRSRGLLLALAANQNINARKDPTPAAPPCFWPAWTAGTPPPPRRWGGQVRGAAARRGGG